jgi:hypothetical protein
MTDKSRPSYGPDDNPRTVGNDDFCRNQKILVRNSIKLLQRNLLRVLCVIFLILCCFFLIVSVRQMFLYRLISIYVFNFLHAPLCLLP